MEFGWLVFAMGAPGDHGRAQGGILPQARSGTEPELRPSSPQALVQNPIDDAHAGVDTARNGLSEKLRRVQSPSPISYATPAISGTSSAMDSTTRVGENGNSRNDSRVLDPVNTRML